MIKSLNGEWLFKQLSHGNERWLPATVPGCNYLDLMNNGLIPNPFFGMNEKEVFWVAQEDWEYKKSFLVSEEELLHEKIFLCCNMLDTICKIYLNDSFAGSASNCHVSNRLEIKKMLVNGENHLRIVFASPVKYAENRCREIFTPPNTNGIAGITHLRKPQSHFGWDWGPVLPPSGISGDIWLSFENEASIEAVKINQVHEKGTVRLSVECEINSFNENELSYEVLISAPGGGKIMKGGNCVSFFKEEIKIDNPELWWTRELSGKREQPLYDIEIKLFKGGALVHSKSQKIGLRTIELNRDYDKFGKSFQFVLNGVPLFIKGTNWIPADSFITRSGGERLETLIDAARFSNINMIRVWGGGYYESDEFYDLCSKRGILVWQDFAFACNVYPFFKTDFLNNVKREIKSNVLRIRNQACLALWCGNNEIEQMSPAWKPFKKYMQWSEHFFHEILEKELRKYDSQTAYTPSSPCGITHAKAVNADNVGDTHLWAVWHGLQPMDYYRKRLTRFCSEFGFESLPDMKTVKKFAGPHDRRLSSPVFDSHQKCKSGNEKMVYYIASRFRLPEKLEDFVYLSQIAQAECVSDATEHWRRNRERCHGAMYWQLNDCWPVCSWSSIDYYGNYKALQYLARHVNAPLSVSVENGKETTKIFALNDLNTPVETTIKFEIFNFESGLIRVEEQRVVLPALCAKEIFVFNMKKLAEHFDLSETGLAASLIVNGKTLNRKIALFKKEKQLKLPKAEINKTVLLNGNKLEIRLQSEKYARLVCLSSALNSRPFSDNFFDILPGEKVTVSQPLDERFSPEEQRAAISAFCCTDVEAGGNALEDKLKQAKVFFKPMNLASWVYFGLPFTYYRL